MNDAAPAPDQNRLLAALPRDIYRRLLSHLEPIAMPLGLTVHDASARQKYIYFLVAGIASRLFVTKDGSSAEVAVTGNEGMIGLALVTGTDSTPDLAVMQSPGFGYRINADVFKQEFSHNGALHDLLLRYMQALVTQIGQTAVCYRHHTVQQQLCRWLLASIDRIRSNRLQMTQELIANMLGVRRQGVAGAARALRNAKAIDYDRGLITILDRKKLEARVCECYEVVKREYDRILLRPAN